jgi:multiple sugar transport system ATP-binding protein
MAQVMIENLTKVFKDPKGESIRAVDNLALRAEHGEFLVLVGPSGCGKSTTLRLIAGLEEATEGTISIDGKMVNGVPPRERDIAMVFQGHALYPHMTVWENMAFGLKVRNISKSEIGLRVNEAADMLGLKDCLGRKPEALSGGQRQRVAVGRAVVRKPKLFLLDEPLSNLDTQMRVQMRREIAKLHARMGSTMIYVTHDQVEAMSLGSRIAVMKQGSIQQIAAPLELYRSPTNMFVAGFIGSPAMNFFRGTVVRDGGGLFFQNATSTEAAPGLALRLDDETKRLEGLAGKNIVLGLRPENIVSGLAHESKGSCEEATVETIEPTGPETYVSARIGEQSFTARLPVNVQATVGGKVSLCFETREAHFFDTVTEAAIRI